VPYSATFTLPVVTPLLNVSLRTHFRDAKKLQARMAGLLRMASHGQRPLKPLQRARVTIVRHSVGVPDADNLVGGCKHLIDCLLTPTVMPRKSGIPQVRHAMGLSFVQDDSSEHMELIVRAQKVRKRAEQCTVITIEEL
jgi:hypothetical protein